MDDLDKIIYRGIERIERIKGAEGYSVDLFAIDVTREGAERCLC